MAIAHVHKINIDLLSLPEISDQFDFDLFRPLENVHDRVYINFCIKRRFYFCSEIQLSSNFSTSDFGQVQFYFLNTQFKSYNFRIAPMQFVETDYFVTLQPSNSLVVTTFEANYTNSLFFSLEEPEE